MLHPFLHSTIELTWCPFLQILSTTNLVVVLGDSNFPVLNWQLLICTTLPSNVFRDSVFRNGLIQLVMESAHIKWDILELIMCKVPEATGDIEIGAINHLIKANHLLIYLCLILVVFVIISQSPSVGCIPKFRFLCFLHH